MKKNINVFLLFGLFVLLLSCSHNEKKGRNNLDLESSPYLKQHENNPIWWQPWGEKALSQAKDENKLIFLSIGYSTCYWCHVMEKDVFEKKKVATVLNRDFISIKVDREERPDVDKVFMNALTRIQGQGGWPISMFLLPDATPIYGESTIGLDRFIDISKRLSETWKNNPEILSEKAEKLQKEFIKETKRTSKWETFDPEVLRLYVADVVSRFDAINGGFGTTQKFPLPHIFSTLLQLQTNNDYRELLPLVALTADKMLSGSIHDIVGGGFHRYTVDPTWNLPHFEKMLYDQAGIAINLYNLYAGTRKTTYLVAANRTLDWTLDVLALPDGGFQTAVDAGEVGSEGESYVWRKNELEKHLSEQQMLLLEKDFGLNRKANFEGDRYILQKTSDGDLPFDDANFHQLLKTLYEKRKLRKQAHIDEKVITAWNGFMISALSRGYQLTGDKRYRDAAVKTAQSLKNWIKNNKNLVARHWVQGKGVQNGTLDDYAYLIQGLIQLYQTVFDSQWLDWAVQLQNQQNALFWDSEKGGYFFNQKQKGEGLERLKVYEDSSTGAANGVSVTNLLTLYYYTFDKELKNKAKSTLFTSFDLLQQTGYFHSAMATAFDFYFTEVKEVVIAGDPSSTDSKAFINYVQQRYMPWVVLGVTKDGKEPNYASFSNKVALGGKATAYVCKEGLCKKPVTTVREFKKQLK